MAMLIAWQAFTQHSEDFFSSWLCPALSLPARRQVYNGITLAVALCPFAKWLLSDVSQHQRAHACLALGNPPLRTYI